MIIGPSQNNGQSRLDALKSYHILDSMEEKDYDDLTILAATICQVPIALISLVDEKRQWFKSHTGLTASETPIDQSFCAHAIISTDEITIIEDAHQDERFKDNPLVTGQPNITFYAGVPLINEDGHALGTLCVIDPNHKTLSSEQKNALKILARQVMEKLEFRRKLLVIEETNRLLNESENKIAELNNTLIFSEARAKTFVQQALVAVIVFRGEDMLIEAVNPPMLELLGKSDDILNRPLLDAIPELKGQEPFNLLYSVLQTGEPVYGFDMPVLLNRNGKAETGYYNYTYSPLTEDGKITGVIDMAVDVTEQVKAKQVARQLNDNLSAVNEEMAATNEEQKALNEELLATIEELQVTQENLAQSRLELERVYGQAQLSKQAAQLGVFDMDVVKGTLEWDDRCRTLFGISHTDTVTYEKDFLTGLHADDHHRVVRVIGDVFNKQLTGGNYDIEYRTVGAEDGQIRWVRAKGKTFFNESDEPLRFIGVVLDITELKQQDQLKNDFIAMVSHELKTPLTSIKGYIQVLLMMARKDVHQMRINTLDKANTQVTKMTKMISGFLDVSRLEAGKIYIDPQRFDMEDLVREVEEETVSANSTHHIVFDPVLTTWVNGDRDKIGQVITNLISNALKYSAPGTTIQISCVEAEGCSLVSVRDEGMGITEKDISKLFERYYRVEGHQLKSIAGFGIGLYLCSEIIKRHDGKIWVVSEVGKGSTFHFSIPVVL